MKKTFFLFTLFFATSNLFAAYQVKIAVYKEHKNLKVNISKIASKKYRKDIIVKKKRHLYYVTSRVYGSKSESNKALAVYKKVFHDAFVADVKGKTVVATPLKVLAKTPKSKETKPLDAKLILENKTVYICNVLPSKRSKKEMIKLDFKEAYVLYTKLSKNVAALEIPYTFDKDTVILSISGMSFKYKIYKEEDGFLEVKSFLNDKKGQDFRFYFDKNLALDFSSKTQY